MLHKEFTQYKKSIFLFLCNMNVKEAFFYIQSHCDTLYDASELNEISWRILEHITGKSKMDMSLHPDLQIDVAQLESICDEVKKNRPIQYILGYEYFGTLKLIVNEYVLIPRPETEELTRLVVKHLKEKNTEGAAVLDIGTGSGCIPVLIKKEVPSADVYAIDISKEALTVARENAIINKTRIQFMEADITDLDLSPPKNFDLIVSNPPYIGQHEKSTMHTRVFDHEPRIALFVKEDPLEFYKSILLFAKKHLTKNGAIFMELNDKYAYEVQKLFEASGFNCNITKDMYGNERFAFCTSSDILS